MRDGCAEERHHRVADELLDRPAEALELAPHVRVVGREHRADILRIELLRACREADEIDEEHRHDLPFLPRPCLARRRRVLAAEGAEPELLRELATARGTDGHGCSV